MVSPRQGVEAAVGFGYDRAYVIHGNVGGKNTVEPIGCFGGIVEWIGGIEVRNHEAGVDAGVGTSGPRDRSLVAE